MNIEVNLSPEMEDFIEDKIARGLYVNATEVIRDAVRRMQVEENRVAAWQTAIKEGDEQLDRGEGIIYSRKTLEAISKSAIKSMHSRRPSDPDALT